MHYLYINFCTLGEVNGYKSKSSGSHTADRVPDVFLGSFFASSGRVALLGWPVNLADWKTHFNGSFGQQFLASH